MTTRSGKKYSPIDDQPQFSTTDNYKIINALYCEPIVYPDYIKFDSNNEIIVNDSIQNFLDIWNFYIKFINNISCVQPLLSLNTKIYCIKSMYKFANVFFTEYFDLEKIKTSREIKIVEKFKRIVDMMNYKLYNFESDIHLETRIDEKLKSSILDTFKESKIILKIRCNDLKIIKVLISNN